MKQAIIYTRFSPRPDADNCQSIDFQEEQCRIYCEQRGLDVLECYRDKAMSGKNMERPGLNKALKRVIKIRGALVSYSLSRLARSTVDAITICDQLAKNNCDLVSVTEMIDTRTPMGRAIYKIMAVFAELERETTAERTKNILRDMQQKGKRISRFPPYGYVYAPDANDKLILVPEQNEQRAIDFILKNRNAGATLHEIKDKLIMGGFKPRGASWYPKSILNIYNRHKDRRRLVLYR